MTSQNMLLVTMHVTSLYTDIPQEQGMQIVCAAYDKFYKSNPPIPNRLILEGDSFKITNKRYLQRHGTSMGTKAAVAFANIFMAEIETQILRQSKHKPLEWIRYIDDIACLWVTTKDEVLQFFQKANQFHPTIKFTAELSETEVTFLDCTTIHKGERFKETGILGCAHSFQTDREISSDTLQIKSSARS